MRLRFAMRGIVACDSDRSVERSARPCYPCTVRKSKPLLALIAIGTAALAARGFGALISVDHVSAWIWTPLLFLIVLGWLYTTVD